jgi:hypothetical protein
MCGWKLAGMAGLAGKAVSHTCVLVYLQWGNWASRRSSMARQLLPHTSRWVEVGPAAKGAFFLVSQRGLKCWQCLHYCAPFLGGLS